MTVLVSTLHPLGSPADRRGELAAPPSPASAPGFLLAGQGLLLVGRLGERTAATALLAGDRAGRWGDAAALRAGEEVDLRAGKEAAAAGAGGFLALDAAGTPAVRSLSA